MWVRLFVTNNMERASQEGSGGKCWVEPILQT
jgi:hypothetical protein